MCREKRSTPTGLLLIVQNKKKVKITCGSPIIIKIASPVGYPPTLLDLNDAHLHAASQGHVLLPELYRVRISWKHPWSRSERRKRERSVLPS